MPSSLCEDLKIERGSSYAQGARHLKDMIGRAVRDREPVAADYRTLTPEPRGPFAYGALAREAPDHPARRREQNRVAEIGRRGELVLQTEPGHRLS
jgi:hypothetical protein